MRSSRWLLFGVLLTACAGPRADAPSPHTPSASSASLPFIANDYATALAQARARRLPLFVESWAPW